MNDIRSKGEALLEAFEDFRREVQLTDKQTYERWRAGGCMVSNDFITMYGNVEELIERLADDGDENEEYDYEDSDDEDADEDECPLGGPHDWSENSTIPSCHGCGKIR